MDSRSLSLTHSKDFKEQDIKLQKPSFESISGQSKTCDNIIEVIAKKKSHCFYRSNKFIPENSVVYTIKNKYSYIIKKGEKVRVQLTPNAIRSKNVKEAQNRFATDPKNSSLVTGFDGYHYCVRHNPDQEIRDGLSFFTERKKRKRAYIILKDKNGNLKEVNIQRLTHAYRSIRSTDSQKLDPPLEESLYKLIAREATKKANRKKEPAVDKSLEITKKPKLVPLTVPLPPISFAQNKDQKQEIQQNSEELQENFLLTPPPLPVRESMDFLYVEPLTNLDDLKENNSFLANNILTRNHEIALLEVLLRTTDTFDADEKKRTNRAEETRSKKNFFEFTKKYTGDNFRNYCVHGHPEQPIRNGLPIFKKGLATFVEIPQSDGKQIDPVRIQRINDARRNDRNKKQSPPLPEYLWQRIAPLLPLSLGQNISPKKVRKRKKQQPVVYTTEENSPHSLVSEKAPYLPLSLELSSELASLELKIDFDEFADQHKENPLALNDEPYVLSSPIPSQDPKIIPSSPLFSLEFPSEQTAVEELELDFDEFADQHKESPLALNDEPYVLSSPIPSQDPKIISPSSLFSLEFPSEQAVEELDKLPPEESQSALQEISLSSSATSSKSTKKSTSSYSPLFFKNPNQSPVENNEEPAPSFFPLF
jgi:hypothetical protein